MFHNNTESFISENCSVCQVELIHIEDIFTDLETGNYICQDCTTYHQIKSVPCKECL